LGILITVLQAPSVVAGKRLTDLIVESSVFAKVVLLILVLFSVTSWAIIIYKYFQFRSVESSTKGFLREFRRRKSLEKSLATLSHMKASPFAGIFGAAFVELESLANSPNSSGKVVIDDEGLEHIAEAIDRAGTNEVVNLEKYVVFLATTANASPFLGLLGTVWGIMTSFAQIGVRGTATLAVVAPGIAEALIATVAGLAAAIPALIGYNYFTNRLRRIASEIDNFKSELFSAIKKELSEVAEV
jgi:biopolymer transport protein TolQ